MSQATHASDQGARKRKNLPPRRTQKALLGAKMQKKNMANSTLSARNPNTNPEINCSNSDNILSWFSKKTQITRGSFFPTWREMFKGSTLWLYDNAPFWSMSS